MPIKPTARLKIVLMADATVVAELEDADLWRAILAKRPTKLSAATRTIKQWAQGVVSAGVDHAQIEQIILSVCELYGIPIENIRGAGRQPRFTLPRMVAMWLLRQHTRLSYPAIGLLFDRHHTTVMAACDRLRRLSLHDPLNPSVTAANALSARLHPPPENQLAPEQGVPGAS